MVNVSVVLGTFLVANVATIFRGGSGYKSVIGLGKCDTWSWVILFFYIILSLVSSTYGSWFVIKK